ncbi:hypothetical protein EJ110_NYTH54575 [Nymphaea thermarum]|nr:hypothetical protein EJ110_NYTH54575 [Nymphaea thermarum]
MTAPSSSLATLLSFSLNISGLSIWLINERPSTQSYNTLLAHFPYAFLEKLKSKASGDNPCEKPYTTFECLTAHLRRKITRVRNLEVEFTKK